MDTTIVELVPKDLRKLAFTTAGLLAGLFGVILPWSVGYAWPLWPWMLASALALWGLLWPASLRPVYRGWMGLALALGKLNSTLLLGIVFLFLFTPAGVIMRLFGYDPLLRRYAAHARSYRKPSVAPSRSNMERPY
ncbi:MAG: SxtJ family membrane protein [Nitrospirota bacterium]